MSPPEDQQRDGGPFGGRDRLPDGGQVENIAKAHVTDFYRSRRNRHAREGSTLPGPANGKNQGHQPDHVFARKERGGAEGQSEEMGNQDEGNGDGGHAGKAAQLLAEGARGQVERDQEDRLELNPGADADQDGGKTRSRPRRQKEEAAKNAASASKRDTTNLPPTR